MGMISSMSASISGQQMSADMQNVQVALLKKVMDSQEAVGAQLVEMMEQMPTPKVSADGIRGTLVDVYA